MQSDPFRVADDLWVPSTGYRCRHEELTLFVARHDSPWELASMLFDVRDAFEHLERAEKVLELRTEQRMDTRQELAAVRAARERIGRLLPR